MELLQHQMEGCDSLQALCLFHSLGGGTGSGLGTKLVAEMADALPKKVRLTASIFPSHKSQDVVTSPYNVTLSLAQLTEHADLVLPIDNCKLADLALDAHKLYKQECIHRRVPTRLKVRTNKPSTTKPTQISSQIESTASTLVNTKTCHNNKGFKTMNLTAARILIDLTAGTRFQGDNCTRINEIIASMGGTRCHYITSSVSSMMNTGFRQVRVCSKPI
jgi:tubulin epsilon